MYNKIYIDRELLPKLEIKVSGRNNIITIEIISSITKYQFESPNLAFYINTISSDNTIYFVIASVGEFKSNTTISTCRDFAAAFSNCNLYLTYNNGIISITCGTKSGKIYDMVQLDKEGV